MDSKECTKCIHKEVCKTAESCDGYVSRCEHFNPGWISVKDRLPKDTYEYWVAYKGGNDYFYTTGYFDGKYWRATTTLRHILVTHWMPLPQPPKGE